MNCKICLEYFDLKDCRPITILMCCHTFCIKCLNNLKITDKYLCPTCNQVIIEEKENYSIIEFLEPNLKVILCKNLYFKKSIILINIFRMITLHSGLNINQT